MDADSGEPAEQVQGVTSEVLRLFKPIGLRAWSFATLRPTHCGRTFRGEGLCKFKVGVLNC